MPHFTSCARVSAAADRIVCAWTAMQRVTRDIRDACTALPLSLPLAAVALIL